MKGRWRAAALVLALCASGLAACADEAEDGPAAGGSRDAGDFELTLEPPEREEDEEAAGFVEEAGTAEGILDAMNETLNLPRDIRVVFASTEDGPGYDPSSRTIVFGYPFVDYVASTFAEADTGLSEEELLTKTDNVIGFVLLHEIGHALIDQLRIPVTGREEDSADNLATVITAEAIEEGGLIALDFADFFATLQEDPAQLDEVDFWDEHSLDIQRATGAVCLIYGSDPDEYEELTEAIPEERAERCPEEWRQISESWDELLSPHTKE